MINKLALKHLKCFFNVFTSEEFKVFNCCLMNMKFLALLKKLSYLTYENIKKTKALMVFK